MQKENPNRTGRTCHERMLRVVQAIIVGFVLNPSAANAEVRRRFTLDYQGVASCPTESQLLDEVQRRAPTAERVLGGPVEVRALLTVGANGEHQRGIIDLESKDGPTHREVEADDCAEVVRALALILAMAIDPDAGSSPRARENTTEVERAREPPRHAGPATSSAEVWWAAGASVGLAGGVAPSPSLSEGLLLEMGRGHEPGWSAHVRLAGVHAHGSATAGAGSADFDLLGLRIASCPYRIGIGLTLSGCASFDWGRLQGRGSHTIAAQSSAAAWLAPGGFIDAELRALPWLRLQLELGALLPLARDRFYFGPDETVHRIPSVAGYGGLNVLVGG